MFDNFSSNLRGHVAWKVPCAHREVPFNLQTWAYLIVKCNANWAWKDCAVIFLSAPQMTQGLLQGMHFHVPWDRNSYNRLNLVQIQVADPKVRLGALLTRCHAFDQTYLSLKTNTGNHMLFHSINFIFILPHDIPSNSYGLINIPLIIHEDYLLCRYLPCHIFRAVIIIF